MGGLEDGQPPVPPHQTGDERSHITRQEIKAEAGGSISNVVQLVLNADVSGLWKGIQSLIRQYWPVLIALFVVDGALLAFYQALRARYLLDSGIALIAIILATSAILGW